MLTPEIRDHRGFKLTGLRRFHAIDSAADTIPPQWDEFNGRAVPGSIDAAVTYGATCQMDKVTRQFEYLTGVEIDSFDSTPADMGRMIVPPATYAVFTVETVDDIPKLWQQIMMSWIPETGYLPADTPNFERYDARYSQKKRGPLEVWLPIA